MHAWRGCASNQALQVVLSLFSRIQLVTLMYRHTTSYPCPARQHSQAICLPHVTQRASYVALQDLDTVHASHEAAREAVRSALTAATLRDALRRLLPRPARARYVSVTLLPQAPLAARVVRCICLPCEIQFRNDQSLYLMSHLL